MIKKYIRIGFLFILILLTIACSKPIEEMSVDELLETGEKFLVDMKYEEAVVYFEHLIEIEPMNPRGYIGVAKAYDALGKKDQAVSVLINGLNILTENTEGAVNILEQLIELEKENSDWYEKLAEMFIKVGDWEKVESLLSAGISEKGMSEEGKTSLRELLLAKTVIDRIIQSCSDSNYESVLTIMQSEDYKALQKLATILEESGVVDTAYGKLGIYKIVSDTYGDYMFYCGDYVDNRREGEGLWFGYYEGNNYIAQGTWINDLPNGDMKIKEWYSGLNETVTYRLINGNVVDGLWDGKVFWGFEHNNGEAKQTFPVSFKMGHWVIINEKMGDDGVMHYEFCETDTDGEGAVMESIDPEIRSVLEGIEGFIILDENE